MYAGNHNVLGVTVSAPVGDLDRLARAGHHIRRGGEHEGWVGSGVVEDLCHHKPMNSDTDVLGSSGSPARQPRNVAVQLLLKLVPLQIIGRFINASSSQEEATNDRQELGIGFRPFPSHGDVITDDHINELRNQI